MKKFFAGLLLVLAVIAGAVEAEAATKGNSLIINRTDGVKEYLALSSELHLESQPGAIIIKRGDLTLEYDMAEVSNFTFGTHTFRDEVYEGTHRAESAIDAVEAPERELSVGDGILSASQTITVFNLKGEEVAGGLSVSTGALPRGIYIVRVGSTTLKLKL